MTGPPADDRTLRDRAEELFAAVFSLPLAGRTEALERACRADAGLRDAVSALLAAHDEPLAVLQQADRGPDPGTVLSLLPRRIGEFHILELLGRGGMGAVYRAEQENPRRHVALKVLLPTGLAGDSLRRLQQEAEVLGRLQHPGIAQIFGAGSYSSPLGEQPFFAMELVAGVDLLQHCRDEGLDARARCELIAKVCDAVQHAHDRGVVHRDLKPGNVLVAVPDPGIAQPKVLDFGIARCVDPDQQLATFTTQSGLLLGTLAYMSPEQFLQGQADATSDVYSLGVMLYELVSGRLPFDFTQKSMTEVSRLLAEVDPEPLRSSGATSTDLQTIASRALAKEPTERYPTAAALAADLRRFLADEPIQARPLTLAYQLRKFARRHRAFVIGVLATMLALVAGTIVSLAFMFEAQTESARAQHSEYVAQLRAAGGAWRLDPQTARTALDQVADRQGLEWQLLSARLAPFVVSSPIGQGPQFWTTTIGTRGAEMLQIYAPMDGRSVHLRDAATGRELWQRSFEGAVVPSNSLVTLSQSGNRVAIVLRQEQGQELLVLDTASGATLQQVAVDKGEPFTAFTADERYLVWTDTPLQRDVRRGVVRSLDLTTGAVRDIGPRVGRVRPDREGDAIWMSNHYRFSAATGERLPSPPLGKPPDDAQTGTYPSPDGRWIAVQREQHRNAIVYDAKGEQVHVLNGARTPPGGIAFCGDRIATTHGGEGVVRVWDLRTGKPERTYLTANFGSPGPIALAADGVRLYCSAATGAGWVDLADGQSLLVGHSDYILSGALDATGHLLATGDTSGELRLWDLDTAACLGVMQLEVQIEAIVLQGRQLWCRTEVRSHTIDLARWIALPAPQPWPPNPQSKGGAVVTRAGCKVTCLPFEFVGQDYRMRSRFTIADADGAKREFTLEPCRGGPELSAQQTFFRTSMVVDRARMPQLAIDASDRWLGVGSPDGSFAVVEIATGRVVGHRDAHYGPVGGIAVLPQERRVVTGGHDGTLRFWDLDTFEELYFEAAHERGIEGVVATPDGQRLVTWSADRTIRISDKRTAHQRYDALQSEAADRAAARAWVDGVWDQLGGAELVAARIDAEVDPVTPRWRHVLARQLERLAAGR